MLFWVVGCCIGCYAQNGYIVSTASRQASSSVESPEKQFIDDHFKYYSLCDWTPGMKFMVIPERKDLVIPVFKSAETGKDVDSGELKYKIMEFLGTEVTAVDSCISILIVRGSPTTTR